MGPHRNCAYRSPNPPPYVVHAREDPACSVEPVLVAVRHLFETTKGATRKHLFTRILNMYRRVKCRDSPKRHKVTARAKRSITPIPDNSNLSWADNFIESNAKLLPIVARAPSEASSVASNISDFLENLERHENERNRMLDEAETKLNETSETDLDELSEEDSCASSSGTLSDSD